MGNPLITFDLRRGRVFVGDGEDLAKLFKLAPIGLDEAKPTVSNIGFLDGPTQDANPTGSGVSVREFARRFAHRKLFERIAVLLHYAHRIEGRGTLTSRELSDWFGLCGFKTPVRMDKALDNLMRQRHMVQRAGPGLWALTAAGESVALDLLEATDSDHK
jgi:hypothetical protein